MERLNDKYGLDCFSDSELHSESDEGEEYRYEHKHSSKLLKSTKAQNVQYIYDHFNTTGHSITFGNFSILGREGQNLNRAIKEVLFIRVNNPSLNRNIGKFHLPHIWDEVLFNTSELKLN